MKAFIFISLMASVAASAWAKTDPIYSVNSISREVVVLGDVEGMKSRLDSFIQASGAFVRLADGSYDLKDGKTFVYQGDATDRGDAAREILNFLVTLKERRPERVILLIGNRDGWKLELITDLSDEAMLIKDKEREKLAREQSIPNTQKRNDKIAELMGTVNMAAQSEKGWEYRRAELARSGASTTDQDVYNSFVNDMKPTGLMAKYLRLAQLVYIDEPTKTLFVHGAVNKKNLGLVPGQDKKINDIRAWAEELNAWARKQVEDGFTKSKGAVNKAQALIDYVHSHDGTVINDRFVDRNGYPEVPSKEVRERLMKQGLFRVSVGHTPSGEFPVISRNGEFQIVLTDGSFNKTGVSPVIKMNGDRISSVMPLVNPAGGSFGEIKFDIAFDDQSPIGRPTSEKSVVIGQVNDEFITYNIGPNFSRNYKSLSAKALRPMTSLICRDIFR